VDIVQDQVVDRHALPIDALQLDCRDRRIPEQEAEWIDQAGAAKGDLQGAERRRGSVAADGEIELRDLEPGEMLGVQHAAVLFVDRQIVGEVSEGDLPAAGADYRGQDGSGIDHRLGGGVETEILRGAGTAVRIDGGGGERDLLVAEAQDSFARGPQASGVIEAVDHRISEAQVRDRHAGLVDTHEADRFVCGTLRDIAQRGRQAGPREHDLQRAERGWRHAAGAVGAEACLSEGVEVVARDREPALVARILRVAVKPVDRQVIGQRHCVSPRSVVAL
jgi:hypothetical protein